MSARPTAFLVVLLLPLLSGCGGPDSQQAQLCARLVVAFAPEGAEVLSAEADPDGPRAVVVRYRAGGETHWIRCRFSGGTADIDRLALIAVATDLDGDLSPVRLHLLRRWLGMFAVQAAEPGDAASDGRPPAHLYALQQAINAVAPCCIYGLLAIGYTLVYGMVGSINLAFGEMAMIGGYVAFLGLTALVLMGVLPLTAGLLVVLAAAATVGAAYGWATERAVFRPLAGRGGQAPLIATIGLAVLLQEYVRLVQGSRDRWLQPLLADRWPLADGASFVVSVSTGQLLVLASAAALYLALRHALARTQFGRSCRACSDDPRMAALLGVDVRGTVALTFVVGTVYAAVAGGLATLYYGLASFYTGQWIGLKALTAAILGGIGSVPGAMLGGLAIGAFETAWSAYLPAAYKDVGVFALLIAVLVFRPTGLLGRASGRGD